MNIKSIYAAVCDYFNPKPVVEDLIKSGKSYDDTAEAMREFYRKRYLLILKVNYGLMFNKEASYNFLSAIKELYTGLLSVVVSIVYIISMLIVLLVWEPLKFLFRLPFGMIADCAKTDMRAIRKAYADDHFASSREKRNVCGLWSFTATCTNRDFIPQMEGFANGFFSYEATENAKHQIELHVREHLGGTIDSFGCVIDDNYQITIKYCVREVETLTFMGSDEV